MANVKNITELPLAESAEGLNLIVNDGGSAKQIAASAVGAQADWAETNENSPAFVKNKPGVAQPDWNENDGSKAAFIKNKPFYDTRKFDTIEVTFDGNIENKENVNPEESFYLVKVSDKTPTKEEIIGSTISMNSSGEISTLELSENELEVMGDLLIGPEFSFLIAYTDCSLMGLSFTKGLWFPRMMGSDSYVSSLSWYGTVSGELKQINSKCIKDMYYTEKIVNAEVLAEITKIPEVSEDNDNMIVRIEEPMVTLVENGIYTVTWNGVECQCMCETMGDGIILRPLNTPTPEFIVVQLPKMKNEGYNAVVEVYDGSESVTISIIGTYDKIHKIDPKYIPSEGENALAIGKYAHAEGSNTTASGNYSHAEGNQTKALGLHSHAEGLSTEASEQAAHAEGTGTKASGMFSHAEGSDTKASGMFSHAEGMNTTASGTASHAEGNGTTASEVFSHAEGISTTASGQFSHAEGNSTTASGVFSHAEGYNTIASTTGAHAEGQETTAKGTHSHAEGLGTKASSSQQHAQGRFNIEDTGDIYAHIVGNGTTDARSNAHTLDWSGNAWYAGTVECAGINLTSPNGTKYYISVADDGTLSANAMPS